MVKNIIFLRICKKKIFTSKLKNRPIVYTKDNMLFFNHISYKSTWVRSKLPDESQSNSEQQSGKKMSSSHSILTNQYHRLSKLIIQRSMVNNAN